MRALIDVPDKRDLPRERALEALVSGLVALNVELIATHNLPSVYDCGARYRRDPAGVESWTHALDICKRGYGDCEDLASYRAAELQVRGIGAIVQVVRTGRKTVHARVLLPDGTVEDPARELGMGEKRTIR